MTTDTLTKTIPGTMERPLHRTDYKNGQLTVVFTDAAHLADAWNFADKHGKTQEFEQGVMRLIRMALGGAVPSRAFQHESYREEGVMIQYPAQPGQEAKITISPDNHRTPSFLFQETPGLVGGLIFHSYDASWSIHT
jgi:hypothetical protein